jgi:hypothetical protein
MTRYWVGIPQKTGVANKAELEKVQKFEFSKNIEE